MWWPSDVSSQSVRHFIPLLFVVSFVSALYDSSDDVIDLTASNFHSRVINGDEIWVVEFYAPWCGHCKALAPEYKKAANALKGIVKVGAVDMTQHQSVGQPYNVQGFPTIKIFGGDKQKPSDFQGQRTAKAIVDAAMREAQNTVTARLGEKKSKDVIELTDDNFEEQVLHSKDMWLVEFYAPWCGHCKQLKPHWEKVATELNGKVKVAALDATVHRKMAEMFGIQGFPTIKFFSPGSSASDAQDYDGSRTASDILSWINDKINENRPPPEVVEATSPEVVDQACKEKQLCIFSVLPDILDCQSECRNQYLEILKDLAAKFRKNPWGWLWTAPGKQTKIEEALGMGGFGYPALAAINYRKMKYAMLKGSFGKDGIHEFLRDLSYGRGRTAPLSGTEFPKIEKYEPWDGKDGEMPVEEELDLSDVDLDDVNDEKNKKKKSEL
ncbi:hypothetical protein AB6A40_000822 [Gnathostoma spinigerum]|uniref:Protein disulfide-isomerase A6 homolog n=1 Tax=Gnathostoma spinigerum TaxID=75299 RepID=A0ABD6EBF8_9BILA